MEKHMLKKRKANRTPKLFITVCVLPAFLLTALFLLWPTVQVLWVSLTDASLLRLDDANFVGLDNFRRMFGDRHFVQAVDNTVRLVLVVPIVTVALALLFAFLITQTKLKERSLYRTTLFFPSIVSMVVIGIIWSFVFHPTMGILNTLLDNLGMTQLARTPWTGFAPTALWTVAAALIWQAAGYHMVIHIAAIDSISTDIFEASRIDGAGPLRQIFNITLPMIKNVVGITLIFAISGTLTHSFALTQIMTGGGPNGASRVLLLYIFEQGFRAGRFGYAMAISAFTMAMAVLISAILRWVTNRGKV